MPSVGRQFFLKTANIDNYYLYNIYNILNNKHESVSEKIISIEENGYTIHIGNMSEFIKDNELNKDEIDMLENRQRSTMPCIKWSRLHKNNTIKITTTKGKQNVHKKFITNNRY